jgi:hypothetical protein
MAANTFQCTIKQAIGGVPFVNVIHVIDPGDHTPDELATGLSSAWVASSSIGDVVQTTDVDYLGFNIRSLDGVHDGVDVAWANGQDTGNVATETAPISLALVYSLRTNHPGRSGRGRAFIAGVRHDLYAAKQLKWNLAGSAGAEVSPAFAVFAGEFADAVDGATIAVYSRKNDASYPLINPIPQSIFGEQRRRSGRVTP